MADQILDVDLAAFESGDDGRRAGVVDGVMRSLQHGFVYLDAGLSPTFLDEVYGLLDAFFDLSDDDKRSIHVPDSHGQTGYTGLLVETPADSDTPDWKEMLNWGPAVPAAHPLRTRYPHRYHDPVYPEALVPGIGDALTRFGTMVLDAQRRFLRIVATGIGVADEFFDEQLVDSPTLNRAIRYPPMSAAPDDASYVWAGAHADINLVTMLPRATDRGLQVDVDGDWVDAEPPDGHVIANTGIMLDRVTNGLIPPGWHRVVAEPGQSSARTSVVQFCHPTPWTVLAPVASCVTDDRPQRVAPMLAADLLDQVLYDINLLGQQERV